jgi:hypothetical protein
VKPTQTTIFWLSWCKEELAQGKNVLFLARGWSMFPSIWPGARLEIKPIDCSELCVGMVVAFERAEQIVVHRVIDIDQQFFQTQGDSLLQADERCDYSALIGVVVCVNDKGQHRALRKRRRAKMAILTNNMFKHLLILLSFPLRKAKRFFKAQTP